jgi:hypothetical protein
MAHKHDELDDATQKWITEQEELMDAGENIVQQASDEALEYVKDAIEHINDKQWRKMVMSTQAVEMGIGVAVAEHLVPIIYKDMTKTMHKRLKLSKETARALQHIYIGRVIKNVRRALNERDK